MAYSAVSLAEEKTKSHVSYFALLPLFLALLIGLAVAGCSDDEGKNGPVCPAEGVAAELVGDWVALDGDGNMMNSGMRIARDGSRQTLGVHWATGTLAVAQKACNPPPFRCVGNNLVEIPVIPGGLDTLSWSMSSDELTLTRISPLASPTRYRGIELGTKVTDPVTNSFSYTLDGEPRSAPVIWPRVPAIAEAQLQGDSPQLMISGEAGEILMLSLRDFHGTDSYNLTGMNGSYANLTISDCSDYLELYQTQDDSLSSVSVSLFDTGRHRCSGTFDITVHGPSGETKHVAGSFDVPLNLR